MKPFEPLEYAFAAMAVVMLALFIASYYFDEDRVRRRRYARNRADLRAVIVNRRGARR